MKTTMTGLMQCRRPAAERTKPSAWLVLVLVLVWPGPVEAQTIESPFNTSYSLINLGEVPGLPVPYGGLTFKAGDNNTILIGGLANNINGKLYSIPVVRDAANHITGFANTATFFAQAAYNDAGVAYGQSNLLFLARWPVNEIGQTGSNSTNTDKTNKLDFLDVPRSPGGLGVVPTGFPGAGQLKTVVHSVAGGGHGRWYRLDIAPDGRGTFGITSATLETTIEGGPEGFVYVPAGSPQFRSNSVVVCEYRSSAVSTYALDKRGAPLLSTRRLFISGLSRAEGAAIDPLTGDFLFSFSPSVTNSYVAAVRRKAAPTADLVLTKIAWPDPATITNALTYTLTISNLGPDIASNVALTDTLPANVGFGYCVPSQGTCTNSDRVVTCALGQLSNSAVARVTIVVTNLAIGWLTNQAGVSATESDPNLTNNTATITTVVRQ